MGTLSRIRLPRRRRRDRSPVFSGQRLSDQTGLPLLLEAPESALGGGGGGIPSASLSRGQLEAARSLIDGLRTLTDGEPRSIFVLEGIEEGDGVSPALALATVAALDGRRTLLVEVDFRHRSMSGGLNLAPSPGSATTLTAPPTPSGCSRRCSWKDAPPATAPAAWCSSPPAAAAPNRCRRRPGNASGTFSPR